MDKKEVDENVLSTWAPKINLEHVNRYGKFVGAALVFCLILRTCH
jgi:hypothetical protein